MARSGDSGLLELGVDRHRMAGEHRHAHARHPDTKVGDAEDLAALAAHLLLFVGLAGAVVDDGAGHRQHVERDRCDVLVGRREVDRVAVEGQRRGAVTHLALLLVELVDALAPGPGHGLVRAHDDATEPRFAVQRREHGHERHRRAVRVGDDALGDVLELVGIDLGDDERHVGIHAPRRGVVDDDQRLRRRHAGASSFEAYLPAENSATSRPS